MASNSFDWRWRACRLGLLAASLLLVLAVSGCRFGRPDTGGRRSWFGPRQPTPSRTMNDFLDQPRLDP